MKSMSGRARAAAVLICALALVAAYPGASSGSTELNEQAVYQAMEDVQARVEAINDTDDVPEVVQNLIPGAIERRNIAITQYQAAQSPPAFSKPEYAVVWSGKMNAGDMNGNYVMRFINQGQLSPASLREVAPLQLMPGLDAQIVLDVRRLNVDGTPNPDYGKVVNFVQVPPPFGVEGEPHHMQYEWQPGQPIVAGHLFTDLTTIWDVSDIPNITLKNTIRPEENPIGAFPDAYDFVGDKAIGTYMTAGMPNYGGSPGSVVVFNPDSAKGMVQASETPASQVGAVSRGNPNGVPEPCSALEGRPMGTCGNPHGIQARPDLGVMVTNDYADARELGSDPIKTLEEHALRPTNRVWDISDPVNPKLVSVGHVPPNPVVSPNRAHENLGIMEGAKTYGDSKGFFSGSMCGGGIFFLPDATNVQPDSSSQWKQVFHDGIAEMGVTSRDIVGSGNGQGTEAGACAGGAWHQVSKDNRFLFRAVGGRNPGSTNTYDNGAPKMIYSANIEDLVQSAIEDGNVDCSIETAREVGQGHGDEADCPTLADTLTVDDYTTGGPHWAALDNHNFTESGGPTRLMWCNYFVARTGYDGNHRCYMANVNPDTGELSYDTGFRDEYTGALGVDFNRRDWPGLPDGGFYKPHSMVFVTPTAVG